LPWLGVLNLYLAITWGIVGVSALYLPALVAAALPFAAALHLLDALRAGRMFLKHRSTGRAYLLGSVAPLLAAAGCVSAFAYFKCADARPLGIGLGAVVIAQALMWLLPLLRQSARRQAESGERGPSSPASPA
jgi:hypothetical protein